MWIYRASDISDVSDISVGTSTDVYDDKDSDNSAFPSSDQDSVTIDGDSDSLRNTAAAAEGAQDDVRHDVQEDDVREIVQDEINTSDTTVQSWISAFPDDNFDDRTLSKFRRDLRLLCWTESLFLTP